MVIITDIAAAKVREFMDGQSAGDGVGLRVGVRGGGCSGFQYRFELVEAAEALPGPHRLDVVPAATHLFEEPGALEKVAGLAAGWFGDHLAGTPAGRTPRP